MPVALQPGQVVVDEQDLAALMTSNQRMHETLWRIENLKRDDVRSASTIAAHALASEPTVGELPRFVPVPLVDDLVVVAEALAAIELPGAPLQFFDAQTELRSALRELEHHRRPLAPAGAARATDESTTEGRDR